jgi:ubiquinone/menaquinone biosynthesis C-methylase UbiE
VDQQIQSQFGAVARNYIHSPVHAYGPDLAELVEAIGARGDEVVLDLGTGVGHTAFAVAPRVRAVVGIDLTSEMIEIAREQAAERKIANVRFLRGDVSELPFPDASFDVATSRYSAHHYHQPRQVVRELARVLRPGGRFVLVDTISPEEPSFDTFINAVELLRDRSHVRDYRVSEWQAMLSQAGFSSEVLKCWDLRQNFDDWVKRMRTPEVAVTMLRSLLLEAPEEIRRIFGVEIEEGKLFFFLKRAMIVGQRGG